MIICFPFLPAPAFVVDRGSLLGFLRLDIGTAAIVSPINKIGYQGRDIEIPIEEDGMGPVSRPVWSELVGRQTGEIESDWSVVVHDAEKGRLSK